MHQKARVDLYNSGTSSRVLGQGYCWLAWEEKASPKHKSLFYKVFIKALWSQSTGPHQGWPGCGLFHIFSFSLCPNRQCIFSYIHTSCITWKEKTQALNLVLQFMYFWDAGLQIYLVAMMPNQTYSNFSSNFQILSAERSWADTA